MNDREDEEEIQQNFCFVLADELEKDGIISYHAKQLLDLNDPILPLFSSLNPTVCLMVHLVRQDHGLVGVVNDVDGGTGTKDEQLLVEEVSRQTAVASERTWRQQETVIIYDQEACSAEVDFDEDVTAACDDRSPSSSSLHVPSKWVITQCY